MKENEIQSAVCPICNSIGLFVPPSKTKSKKLIVEFKCSKGHIFTKEFDLK